MTPTLTFNQLLIPLVLLTLVGLALLAFFNNNRRQAQKQAQQQRLAALNPPGKNRNHRSLGWRQYFLSAQMAKPTPDDVLQLKMWRALQQGQNAPTDAQKK